MRPEPRQQESVKPLELFFDLVFVLGFTQCTALMAANPTWTGIGQAMIALAVLWWAWVGYAWLTSVIDPEEGTIRLAMFGAMAALLVVGLCVPEAFGDRAVAFAVAYAVVRVGHVLLYLLASREDADLRRSVLGLALSSTLAVGLLLVGAFLDGGWQAAVWLLAIAVDALEPAVMGMDGWTLVPAHFAERHNLVIILALGESIVALGVASENDLTAGVIVAAVLGIGLAAALWWTYFDVVALVTERRLTQAAPGRPRNVLARDSYTYLHFPMVAGIILVALGLEVTLSHLDEHLHVEAAFALLGGTAMYLLAHVAMRLRNAHTYNVQRLVLAGVLLVSVPLATVVPALAAVGGVNVLLWSMIAYETSSYGEGRYRLRHGLEPEG